MLVKDGRSRHASCGVGWIEFLWRRKYWAKRLEALM
jgi:hypothetical protein